MRGRSILISIVVILFLLASAIMVLPWQGVVQHKLIRMLEEKGFASPVLTIDHIGLHGLVLKDVTVGSPPLTLTTLTVSYNLRALANGRIEDIEISGLNLAAMQTDTGWQIEGMDHGLSAGSSSKSTAIPVTLAELRRLPFRSVIIHDAIVNLYGKGWKAQLPLAGKLQQGSDATVHLESKGAATAFGANSLAGDTMRLDLTLDDARQQWHGEWAIDHVVVTSEALTIPPVNAKGELSLTGNTVKLSGAVASHDASYSTNFALMIVTDHTTASLMNVIDARIPLSGGNITVHNVRVPLQGSAPIAVTLEVNKIAIDSMMQTLTGSRATATGKVSGKIPLRISRDGKVVFGKSALTADEPGVIALAPDAIPGDNQQVALVREILKNLHYTLLAVNLDTSPEGNLDAMLAVEGRNPDVENGRAIKLQVHLSGDLLNLIAQNLKLITDPKQFIKQGIHETP